MTNTAKVARQPLSEEARAELMATVSPFEFKTVEIIGGKKFPIGEKFECVKVGISKWQKPYVIISVNGEDEFCDPKNLKALKPLLPARAALVKAEQEEKKNAVIILSGIIKAETEKAVGIKHHAWFKTVWFPKTLITELGNHEDGEQVLYEVPVWKVQAEHGSDGVEALRALQPGFEKMLQPKAVVGKTTVIRKASKK
jgi:hypothetical protein